jgi:hypothetical protein
LRAREFTQEAPFLWHLIGAYSVYLAYIYNALVTPSVDRPTHIWIGRVGMFQDLRLAFIVLGGHAETHCQISGFQLVSPLVG